MRCGPICSGVVRTSSSSSSPPIRKPCSPFLRSITDAASILKRVGTSTHASGRLGPQRPPASMRQTFVRASATATRCLFQTTLASCGMFTTSNLTTCSHPTPSHRAGNSIVLSATWWPTAVPDVNVLQGPKRITDPARNGPGQPQRSGLTLFRKINHQGQWVCTFREWARISPIIPGSSGSFPECSRILIFRNSRSNRSGRTWV